MFILGTLAKQQGKDKCYTVMQTRPPRASGSNILDDDNFKVIQLVEYLLLDHGTIVGSGHALKCIGLTQAVQTASSQSMPPLLSPGVSLARSSLKTKCLSFFRPN